jgi:hypothetical protein
MDHLTEGSQGSADFLREVSSLCRVQAGSRWIRLPSRGSKFRLERRLRPGQAGLPVTRNEGVPGSCRGTASTRACAWESQVPMRLRNQRHSPKFALEPPLDR